MRLFIIIVSLLSVSCDYFSEQEDINYRFYINSGWYEFEQGNYEESKGFFSEAIDLFENNNSENVTEAHLGMGWSNVYHANNSPGYSQYNLREDYRIDAEANFKNAVSEFTDDVASSIYYDALFGQIVILSYFSIKAEVSYYNNPNDSTLLEESIAYSDSLLTGSEELLIISPNYNFAHDERINVDNIYLLRAQTFVRTDEIESAWSEITNIIDLPPECEEQVNIYECLDAFNEW